LERNVYMPKSVNSFFKMEMLLLKIIEIGDGNYYGYQIAQKMAELSNDKIKIAEGVMYPILYRLLDKEYISDKKVLVGKRKTRIYYQIEPKGKEYLNELYANYLTVNNAILEIMGRDKDK
ncbi:PadR family transcriptional regulator, partial [Thomasclavelia sp.]|uniref:PadR family transcriptional regulator n=1 Tax=Thomasclavelia sp. TaxID=3025757 RepID=UPI0025EAD7BC